MLTRSTTRVATLVLLSLLSNVTHAALLSRAGGQAYYDTDLNITWLANANLPATEAFGVSGIDQVTNPGGTATWFVGQDWIAAMNASNGGLGYLGVNDWRLPKTIQPDSSCFQQFQPPGFDSQGYGINCTGSEMGHLANVDGILAGSPSPFTNITASNYWSGTEYAPDTTQAWEIYMVAGNQSPFSKNAAGLYLWPVLDGDIAVVPAPPAVYLLATGIGAIVFRVRRRSRLELSRLAKEA